MTWREYAYVHISNVMECMFSYNLKLVKSSYLSKKNACIFMIKESKYSSIYFVEKECMLRGYRTQKIQARSITFVIILIPLHNKLWIKQTKRQRVHWVFCTSADSITQNELVPPKKRTIFYASEIDICFCLIFFISIL